MHFERALASALTTEIPRAEPPSAAPAPAFGAPRSRRDVLGRLYLASWVLMLANLFPLVREVDLAGPWTAAWTAAVWVTYAGIYLLPPYLLALGVNAALSSRLLRGSRGDDASWRGRIVCSTAVVLLAAVQILVFVDGRIHANWGYHINGFVVNLVTTPGGIDSLGGGTSTWLSFWGLAAAAVAAEVGLLFAVRRLRTVDAWARRAFRPRRVVAGIACVALLSAAERLAYAFSLEADYTPVLAASNAFPLYKGLRIRGIGAPFGIEARKGGGFRMKAHGQGLHYPLAEIRQGPHERWNVVWLVSESLRADSLDPEIMPATWAFAQESTRFTHHYSSGNGTRMGMFGMFYGLYGPYWFPFLEETHGPVLMDVLRKDGYRMSAYTSAAFSYPEFDHTIFAQFASDELHARQTPLGWRSDRRNTAEFLDEIDRSDPSRPFFQFFFFESPHAPYAYPPETAIRAPALEDMNYATLDLERDMPLIRNRYLNACRHLDTQVARILDHLREKGLLDRTIVVITGDHGEEFMEKGRWGHNSAFTEEQTRPPLVIHVPGRAPETIDRMTSHLDLPATVLGLLGVENPASDYSLGHDLFGPDRRDYTVVSEWNDVAYVDADSKVVFPTRLYGYANQVVTDARDGAVADKDAVLRAHLPQFTEVLRDLGRFRR